MTPPDEAPNKRKTSRGHHFVTASYLDGFLDPGETQLFVVDHKTGRTFNTKSGNVALERDFNRIDIEGQEPDALEMQLGAFEGVAIEAVRRVCRDRAFRDDDDLAHVLSLMGLFIVHNPGRRETMRDFRERAARMMMEVSLATPERWASQLAQAKAAGFIPDDLPDVSYEELKATHDKKGYRVEVSTTAHLQSEMELLDQMVPLLAARSWSFLTCNEHSTGFITSDHPATLTSTIERPQMGLFPLGFGMKNTAVIFPLSKQVCLVGKFDGSEDILRLNDTGVAVINNGTVINSRNQVYAANDRFTYSADGRTLHTYAELIWSGARPDDDDEIADMDTGGSAD